MTEHMVEGKKTRLREVAKEFNVGINTIVQFLDKKGIHIESNPNSRIDEDVYVILFKEYATDINLKKESERLNILNPVKPQTVTIDQVGDTVVEEDTEVRITDFTATKTESASTPAEPEEKDLRPTEKPDVKILGKIDLDTPKKTKA